MAKVLFIQPKDIKEFTASNGNIDVDKLLPYIYQSQTIEVQRLLGTKLYDKLISDITGGTLTGNYQTLVNTYIKPILIHYAMMYALPYLSVTISNGGVYRSNPENATALSSDEINTLVEKERDAAQYFSQRMIDFLNFNASAMFSEYYTNSNEDISPDYDDNFGGWVMS
ncbi:MAG: hypothetical protein CBD69_005930 [Crocinitomicaceae bacterium TMED209]|nr:MAG: hypothetical protein CBD69_005930 [Crocinitomicaceae bacterium TMED209]|tara:strand:+ start:263 stop:769 length:507 start_codon:yes stop_codon:yes gene_type:complete